MRDSQRSRVYRAEHALDRPEWNRRLGTVQEVQEYVDRILRSRWFRGAFPGFRDRITGALDPAQRDALAARMATLWQGAVLAAAKTEPAQVRMELPERTRRAVGLRLEADGDSRNVWVDGRPGVLPAAAASRAPSLTNSGRNPQPHERLGG